MDCYYYKTINETNYPILTNLYLTIIFLLCFIKLQNFMNIKI